MTTSWHKYDSATHSKTNRPKVFVSSERSLIMTFSWFFIRLTKLSVFRTLFYLYRSSLWEKRKICSVDILLLCFYFLTQEERFSRVVLFFFFRWLGFSVLGKPSTVLVLQFDSKTSFVMIWSLIFFNRI